MKTEDLIGAELDAAVARALGINAILRRYEGDGSNPITKCERIVVMLSGATRNETFRPSTSWEEGGPIIHRERITVRADFSTEVPSAWAAFAFQGGYAEGPTPLVAAMRVLALSKLGPEID